MYKVFIDNAAVTYQVDREEKLLDQFKDHKFIEAAGGIVKQKNNFLFIKRHGKWDIPKGKLEKGESAEEGAVREIEEECGIKRPQIIDHLINTWHTYEQNGKKFIKKTYWYLLEMNEDKIELIPQTEEGITEVKYFKWNKLGEIKSNTYASILDVINTLESHLNH